MSLNPSILSSRAWYSATILDFLNTQPNAIIGQLAKNNEFALIQTQRDAWLAQIELLQDKLVGLKGAIFFEFNIPRMGRRIDAVLICGPAIFVIEFKVGEGVFEKSAMDQVWDYALDLKNFHEGSHAAPIIPILIATAAATSVPFSLRADKDGVFHPVSVHPDGLRNAIDATLAFTKDQFLDEQKWGHTSYRPTPTIVEAARALYAQHSVDDIARSDAGAQNLSLTSARIEELVDEAKSNRHKLICFVTGVPGAGKTLVGLNVATRRRDADEPTHAVFLSGNGPLVSVLREALTRDEVIRQKKLGNRVRKGKLGESVKAFIQNVHHFRDDALIDTKAPVEHVVIFDEAQRAWNLRQTANFMQRKKNQPGFSQSEPEFLISCMDRHSDWAVVICLVGGGQEINVGEAGIDAWIEAAKSKFPHWKMHISSRLIDSEYSAGKIIEDVGRLPNTRFDDCLHLAVSMRSFRAENVSFFVKTLLDCEANLARENFLQLSKRYPIAITRNLQSAKDWIRRHARGTERYGLVASSKAMRLKPHAIDIRVSVDPVHWFLNGKEDTRSSYYLEDAATEFQVQGLELDWACVNWDGDLRFSGSGWTYHDFRGDRWTQIHNVDNRRYLLNAYRVLLTRARQGMVLFIPPGDAGDPTRTPDYYNSTFRYLTGLGIPELP
jgi:hypothetical protein